MSQNPEPRFPVIVGPTASGKTGRAVDLAQALDGEVISADSRQVYRDMDLGTGKDLEEYGTTPYHLIDVADAGEKYNLFRFLTEAERAFDSIVGRGLTPVVCGGTGMYVEAFVNGLRLPEVPPNPELRLSLAGKSLDELTEILASMKTLHNTTDVDTAARTIRAIEIQTYYDQHPEAAQQALPHPRSGAVIIGVDIDRDSRRRRISQRLRQRLDAGMVDEVRRLLQKGVDPETLIAYGLEYKFLTQHLLGQISYDEMCRLLETAIHQFAKRQLTWLRGMERRGHKINWLPYDMERQEFVEAALNLLRQ